MEFKTPFVIDKISSKNYLESKNGKICCYYDVIPHYYVAVIESKDRTFVKKHCCIFSNLEEMQEYLDSLL